MTITRIFKKYLVQDNDVMKNIYQTDKNQDGFARYLSKYGGSPAYTNTGVQYYSIGERMFEDMKKELFPERIRPSGGNLRLPEAARFCWMRLVIWMPPCRASFSE